MSNPEADEHSFLQSVESYITCACRHLDLADGLEERIRACNSTYTVRFGVRLRGRMFSFTGWRSVRSEHVELAKGGIRYDPHSTADCIVERDGHIWNEHALDVEAVKRHQLRTGNILGFADASSDPDSRAGLAAECERPACR